MGTFFLLMGPTPPPRNPSPGTLLPVFISRSRPPRPPPRKSHLPTSGGSLNPDLFSVCCRRPHPVAQLSWKPHPQTCFPAFLEESPRSSFQFPETPRRRFSANSCPSKSLSPEGPSPIPQRTTGFGVVRPRLRGSAPRGFRPFLDPRLIVPEPRLLEVSEARVLGVHAPSGDLALWDPGRPLRSFVRDLSRPPLTVPCPVSVSGLRLGCPELLCSVGWGVKGPLSGSGE